MSHFTVMVVTPTKAIYETIKEALQPFHEFECTGIADQYVLNVDKLEEARANYEKDTEEKETKTFGSFIEDYYSYKRISENETPDLEDEHKYGWYRENAKGEVIEVIDRTNPSRKWDWWQIGGRWSGMIQLKMGVSPFEAWNGERSRFDDTKQAPNTFDSARKGDIDIQGMRLEARTKAALKYDEVRKAIDPYVDFYISWDDMRAKYSENISKAREEYHGQLIMKEFKKVDNSFYTDIDSYLIDRDAYLEKAELSGFSTFAILLDGKWAERGKMGWWATVSNEDQSWEKNFATILEGIPDDHWLTIVDCHI